MAKILSVDDKEIILRVVVRLLAGLHECATTSSPRHALRLLADGEVFDVIFSDMRLREVSGCDLASVLKSDFALQASRLVMVSGDCYRLQRCQQRCGYFALAKPFTFEDLTSTIERVTTSSGRKLAPCPLVPEP